MTQYNRMEKLKRAANLVIDTLNAGDYFTVIEFDNDAKAIGPDNGLLMSALDESKKEMKEKVDALSPSGGTNYFNAFQKAFDIFKSTPMQDMTSNCRQAILFVSDGAMSDSKEFLYNMIDRERQEYIDVGKQPPIIFTYSFGDNAPQDVPKELSCKYDGVWAKITDTEDLASSMGAYYKYFSYGLSDGINKDFVTWVPPYKFATGNMLGITVSAPVYNKNIQPPILVGVVGMDFSFLAMERAFGEESDKARDVIIKEIVASNKARCPVFSLNSCQKDSLRINGGAKVEDEASCNECSNNTQIQDFLPPLCTNATKWSGINVWNNDNTKFWSYEERTCCNVGELREKETFSNENVEQMMCRETNSTGTIVGSVIGGLLGAIIIFILYKFCPRNNHLPKFCQRNNHIPSPPPVETSMMGPVETSMMGIRPLRVPNL